MNQTVKKILQAKINWSNYPSLNSFKLFKDKAYVILFVADKELDIKNLSAAEISEIISKKFRKKVTHQAIRGALNPKIGDEVEAIQGENGVLNYSLLPKAYSIIGVTNNNANMNFTDNDIILPFEIFENTKDYIKKIIYEIIIKWFNSQLHLPPML